MYSDPLGIDSHRVRLALAEKELQFDLITVEAGKGDAELLRLNSQGVVPTLVDRDLVLYDPRVIIEYLDERYPHPPLMPVDPISRARTRLTLHRIETDWHGLLLEIIEQKSSSKAAGSRLLESLVESSELFAAMPFFLSEEYSLLDATLAPLLWRLPAYGIVLPEVAAPIKQYAKKIFSRPGFQASLSPAEREIVL
jgi:stringent starvation protein A